MSTGAVPTHDTPDPATEPSSRLAHLLRWLGTAAVALSGVIFLLQGLEDMDTAVRSWAYLALMALLTLCGIGTRTLLEDARSARLLLGLAVALVPIQFAQLGGMLHGLAWGEAGASTALFGFEGLSPGLVLTAGAATLLLTPLAVYAGLAVLVRPAAGRLTLAFLLPNLLLLLPWRDSIAGFAVLAILGLLVPAIDAHITALRAHAVTREGRAVRAVLLLPLAIAAVRLGFHVEALAGHCTLAGFWAAGLVYAGRFQVGIPAVRELLYLAAALIATLAWTAWVTLGLSLPAFTAPAVLVPMALLYLGLGMLSELGRIYRLGAAACVAVAAFDLLGGAGLTGTLMALGLGLASLTWGCARRERDATVAGAVITVAAVVMLALQAWQRVDVNGWAALAAAGVVLVVCASVVERYGRTLLGHARRSWDDVRQWA